MRRASLIAGTLTLAVALCLTAPIYASAATYYHHPDVHHGVRPGSDWWRIYPWSPYNYGRNPYNPVVVPYPYYVPTYPNYVPQPPATPTVPASLSLPTATSSQGVPYPGTALINVTVPTTWARVSFDGHDSYTSGTHRTFSTPQLSGAQSYAVSASWQQYGHPVVQQRSVTVLPGQTVDVNFAR